MYKSSSRVPNIISEINEFPPSPSCSDPVLLSVQDRKIPSLYSSMEETNETKVECETGKRENLVRKGRRKSVERAMQA